MFPGFGSHSLPAKDISLGGALIKGFPDVRRKFTAILRKEKIIPTIEDRVDENGIWENFRKTASDDKEWPKKKKWAMATRNPYGKISMEDGTGPPLCSWFEARRPWP